MEQLEKINFLEECPNWLLRLKMAWSALTSRNLFFVGYRKVDWSGKGKHHGLHSGSILPSDPKQRKIILEVLRDTISGIIESYDELEKEENK